MRGVATQESDGGCEGSDAEMIGNGRRGAGERDRDLEEDDELENREERSSESGGGGGFGGWRSHLLGGLTQRVKSWYWGARPLVSFPKSQRTLTQSLFLFFLSRKTRTLFFFSFSLPPPSFCISFFFFFFTQPRTRHFALIHRITENKDVHETQITREREKHYAFEHSIRNVISREEVLVKVFVRTQIKETPTRYPRSCFN